MNKYGKQWGVSVEDIKLSEIYEDPNKKNRGLTMHSVPVTEAMKESVMQGQLMFARRKALASAVPGVNTPFKATVVTSADVANILKKLEIYAKEAENLSRRAKSNFLRDVADRLEAKPDGSESLYATFEAVNGAVFTIRLANHNATVSNFDNRGEDEGVSIVISRKKNKGIIDDGKAHIEEFFYSDKDLRKADNEPYAKIVRSIIQSLYSGKYKDTTGLTKPQEVNPVQLIYSRAYHGTGADFDRFDHSHMGEGEGSQAYGWGTYVTSNRDTGEQYALNIGGRTDHLENLRKNFEGQLQSGTSPYSREELEDKIAELQKEIDDKQGKRHLYTVEIPDDNGENYLHWEKPITKRQSEAIMQAVREAVDDGWGEEFEMELKSGLGYGTYGKHVEGGVNYSLGDMMNYATGEDPGAERNAKLLSRAGIVDMEIPIDLNGGKRY